MSHPVSFSEKAFLNPYYFKYLNPSECQERKVEHPRPSVVETIEELEFNPFTNPSTGRLHQATKPLRVAARIVYMLFVSTVIAPAGALYHGACATKYVASYAFKTYYTGVPNNDIQLAKKHAWCLLTDAWTTFQGAVGVFLGVSAILSLMKIHTYTIKQFAWAILEVPLFTVGSTYGLGGFCPDTFFPRFFADQNKQIGMYISIRLRNDLGIVGPDGGILPFSDTDTVEYEEDNEGVIEFKGPAIEKLTLLIGEAEIDLIDQIRDANKHAWQNNLTPIRFQYPFNGNEVAKALDALFKTLPPSARRPQMVKGIQEAQRKITVLRSLLKGVCELSVNGGYRKRFFDMIHEKSYYTQDLDESFLEEDEYRNIFERESLLSDASVKWSTLVSSLKDVRAINPEAVPFDAHHSLYAKFTYKVGVAKFLAARGEEMPLHELFFLDETFTQDDLIKQYRFIAMKVHPDRNGNSPESTELFKVLNRAKEMLMK